MTVTTSALEGKALNLKPTKGKDLILEGIVATWGPDRVGDFISPRAFDKSIGDFLSGSAALCLNHHKEILLGKVLDLKVKAEGLWGSLRVDGALKDHPTLGVHYAQVESKSLRSASVAGYFGRVGNLIQDIDLVEISLCGTPVGGHVTGRLEVQDVKALADQLDELRMEMALRDAQQLAVQARTLLLDRRIAGLRS